MYNGVPFFGNYQIARASQEGSLLRLSNIGISILGEAMQETLNQRSSPPSLLKNPFEPLKIGRLLNPERRFSRQRMVDGKII